MEIEASRTISSTEPSRDSPPPSSLMLSRERCSHSSTRPGTTSRRSTGIRSAPTTPGQKASQPRHPAPNANATAMRAIELPGSYLQRSRNQRPNPTAARAIATAANKEIIAFS